MSQLGLAGHLLPVGWQSVPAGYLFHREKRIGFPLEKLLSVYRDYGVVPKDSRDDNFNKASEDLGAYQLVEPNDLVINKMKAWQGSVGVSSHRGVVSPAYFVASPMRPFSRRYVHYLLRCSDYLVEYQTRSGGIRVNQWDLDWDNFRRIPVTLPPQQEQERIANFLDDKTARIDALIAEKERLLVTLDEFWISRLSDAMSGGEPKCKKTHYEWYPEIAEGWKVSPFKHSVKFIEGPGILAVDFREEGVPLLRVSSVRGADATLDGCNFLDPAKVKKVWSHFRVQPGDLLISASASMGTVSMVTEETAGAVPYTGLIILRPIAGRATRDFLRHFVVSLQFSRQIDIIKAGATIQHFGPTHLNRIVMALPSVTEQAVIATQLEKERIRHEAIQLNVMQHISLLREYRSSLISAAVTGQLNLDSTTT